MRLTVAVFTAALCVSTAAFAQNQQAGSESGTNADETFKQLVAKCDDVDALMLRARVRLAIGRLGDDAAIADLTKKTEAGLALCGQGKIEEAKATLTETLAAADAKVSDKFGQEGDTNNVKAVAAESSEQEDEVAEKEGGDAKVATEEKKPWWKFW